MSLPFKSTQAPAPASGGGTALSIQRRDAALKQVWKRLSPRLASSAERSRQHVTARAADMACEPVPAGVTVRIAYSRGDAAVQAGDPVGVRLIELSPGARIELPIDASADSAWLVLEGRVDIGGESCAAFDYQERCAGDSRVMLATQNGARLMVREARASQRDPDNTAAVRTTRAGQMDWEVLADGVNRRLLAPPQGKAAAYLVRMAAGAAAPPHRHHRAEECLLLDGEMFLDDILLFSGDFQLAHAGGEHFEASSERGVLLLVHGDLDLDVIEAANR